MQQCNAIAFGITSSVNCLSLLLLLNVLIITSVGFESSQAHVFSPDKTASLLAIANQLKSELKLVGNNLVESDNNLEHLADIAEIQTRKNITSSFFSLPYLDELRKLIESMPANSDPQTSLSRVNQTIVNASRLLDNKIISQVDARDLRNSTIQALNIANMTDEVLREYAIAHSIEPAVITSGNMGGLMNMSIQSMGSSASTNMDDNGMGQMETETNKAPSPHSTSRITNISNYQNAQELAIRTFEIFRDELKPLDLPNTTRSFLTTELRTSSVTGLEEGLALLLNSINESRS